MEMVLHFNDRDPDDVLKFKRALTADNVYCALWDIDQYLIEKLNQEDLGMGEYNIIEKILDDINHITHKIDMELFP